MAHEDGALDMRIARTQFQLVVAIGRHPCTAALDAGPLCIAPVHRTALLMGQLGAKATEIQRSRTGSNDSQSGARTAYDAMFVNVSAEVELRLVSELCQIPPDTPVKQRDLRGHSDAHRCCEKSLMEGALVRVGVLALLIGQLACEGDGQSQVVYRFERFAEWRSTAYYAMFVNVSAEVELRLVSELCHMTPETPVKHGDLRGRSDAHRCCGKSLMESALVRVGVRY